MVFLEQRDCLEVGFHDCRDDVLGFRGNPNLLSLPASTPERVETDMVKVKLGKAAACWPGVQGAEGVGLS
jgi:hypothetical protein